MQGLSMEDLCNKAGNELSKQSIHKYESGKMMPDSNSLIVLSNALGVSIDFFFRPITISIDGIEFRKKSKLGVKKISSIKEIVKDKLERYFEVESLNNIVSDFNFYYKDVVIQEDKDIFSIVSRIKSEWKLGEDGINNLIEILEENRIKVVEIDVSKTFDGLSGVVNGKNPIIVLNKNVESERKRFTALHELGHLLLNFDKALDDKRIERLCDLFASEMLISKDIFVQKIGLNRRDISLQELVDIQIQFGISVDALMYKAKSLNIISDSRYITFHKKKNALSEFKKMVEMSRTKEESSSRFVRLVFRALASEVISISKAGTLLDWSVNDVRRQLTLV